MATIQLNTTTLAVLISGLYCTDNNVDSRAIPLQVWLDIAEKLEYFLPYWNFNEISFEDWVNKHLSILPKILLTDEDIEDMIQSTMYWEHPNGNMVLSISMDIRPINGDNNGKS